MYDPEGDILEVRFHPGKSGNRTGFELDDHIVIFTDKAYTIILGLTFLSYSKLVQEESLSLSKAKSLPKDVLEKVTRLVNKSAASHFVKIDETDKMHARV
jgi:hypothetical protein